MPHPAWEDLDAFFDPEDFGTKAVIMRGSETVTEVLGIFDDPSLTANAGEYEMNFEQPRFTCPEVEVAAVKKLDIVEIEGRRFDLMQDPQRDGTGLSILLLGVPNVAYNAGI